jgi:type I restriction enzyme S subunit
MSADGLWPVVNLGEHATVRARIGWKGLQASEYQDKGYIFLATPNIKGPHIDFRNVNFISKRRYIESPELMLQAGDVLLVKDGSTLGISNIVRSLPGPATVNGSIAVLRCSEGLCPAFLHQLTKATAFQKLINDKKSGLGVPHLFQADLKEFEVPLPSLPEQHRIAEILDTLDEAIRKTEQIIAKLQQMKQGLLHDLLTRGIDENGALRDLDRHPEQFKDSPLGWIPRQWEVFQLGQTIRRVGGLIQTGPFGSQLHASEYVGVGVPVVMPQDIGNESVDLRDIARVSDRKATELGRHRLAVNDAVFARRGDLTRCVAIDEAEVGWLCGTGCLLVRAPQHTLFAEWLTAIYRHDLIQRQVLARAVGSTMVNLNSSILADMYVPIPPAEEQRHFVTEIQSLRNRASAELEALEKLRTLKHGLMDDLLTGPVRVSVPEEAAA